MTEAPETLVKQRRKEHQKVTAEIETGVDVNFGPKTGNVSPSSRVAQAGNISGAQATNVSGAQASDISCTQARDIAGTISLHAADVSGKGC